MQFRMDRPLSVKPLVFAAIVAAAERTFDNPCGMGSYYPLLPGIYRHEHAAGAARLGRVAPRLIVLPGRDRVELHIKIGKHGYRVVYRVACAYFPEDRNQTCIPSERTWRLARYITEALGEPAVREGESYSSVWRRYSR